MARPLVALGSEGRNPASLLDMTRNPFLLPPGPERRELMEQRGLNISQNDWTPEEWAEIQAQAAASLEVFAAMDSPPDLR